VETTGVSECFACGFWSDGHFLNVCKLLENQYMTAICDITILATQVIISEITHQPHINELVSVHVAVVGFTYDVAMILL